MCFKQLRATPQNRVNYTERKNSTRHGVTTPVMGRKHRVPQDRPPDNVASSQAPSLIKEMLQKGGELECSSWDKNTIA